MDYLKEQEGKKVHDHFNNKVTTSTRCIWVPGPIIVGAGPSGLAAAACLKERGVPSLILERANCIASLWQLKTYDRLCLHLPKQFCELPLMPFPSNFPTYPTKQHFVAYLEAYTHHFGLQPVFNTTVVSAEFDHRCGFWRVKTEGLEKEVTEYVCQWLIVASGENAEEVLPGIEGMSDFGRPIIHTSSYKSGEVFCGKSVLVVGCGNSGMEVCLDLCNYNACPSLVVRDTVHVLPQEMLGRSTFGLSMWLLKWFPIRLVDQFLLMVSWFMLGDTAQFGLNRPKLGPLELKNMSGKTPVLDVGTLAKIKSGNIKVFPGIKRVAHHAVEFDNGKVENFDAIILATGYKSNVQSWLKGTNMFSKKDGLPRRPFLNGWKCECGLYAVGFTMRGLLGASIDARRIAEDIEHRWKAEAKHFMTFTRAPSSLLAPLTLYDSGVCEFAKVADEINGHDWIWPHARSEESVEIQSLICCTLFRVPQNHDSIIWTIYSNGKFQTSTTWHAIRSKHHIVPWSKLIWLNGNIPKHNFIRRLAILNWLSTKERQVNRELNVKLVCTFCQNDVESRDYIFFGRSSSPHLWSLVLRNSGIQRTSRYWKFELQRPITKLKGKSFWSGF